MPCLASRGRKALNRSASVNDAAQKFLGMVAHASLDLLPRSSLVVAQVPQLCVEVPTFFCSFEGVCSMAGGSVQRIYSAFFGTCLHRAQAKPRSAMAVSKAAFIEGYPTCLLLTKTDFFVES